MQLSALVTVFLRLFAINWLIGGILLLGGDLQRLMNSSWFFGDVFSFLISSAAMMAGALVLLAFSERLARFVTPKANPSFQIGSLAITDLYCAGFTLVGLYYAITSVGSLLNWVHQLVVFQHTRPEYRLFAEKPFYALTQLTADLVVGTICMAFAGHFARKFSALHLKQAATHAAERAAVAPSASNDQT